MTDLSVIVCIAFDHRASAEGLARFKDCIFRCPFVDSALEVSGTYDLIVQGSCSCMAEYTEHMTLIRPQVAEFASRIETNFISLKVPCRPGSEEGGWLWLPCEGGSKRVDAHLIDKIEAEGDYMRVYVGDWSCLIHQTMHSLCAKLGTTSFIKLHRSSVVRIEFIERLVNVDCRWKARLRDGTLVSVAKSHVREVLRMIEGESSKRRVGPPKERSLAPVAGGVNENIRKLPA
jgi:hypothetical protein